MTKREDSLRKWSCSERAGAFQQIDSSRTSGRSSARTSYSDLNLTLWGGPAPRCPRSVPKSRRRPTQPPNSPVPSCLPLDRLTLLHVDSSISSSHPDLSLDLSSMNDSDRETAESASDIESDIRPIYQLQVGRRCTQWSSSGSSSHTRDQSSATPSPHPKPPQKVATLSDSTSSSSRYPSTYSCCSPYSRTSDAHSGCSRRSADLICVYVDTVNNAELAKYFRPCVECRKPCCVCEDVENGEKENKCVKAITNCESLRSDKELLQKIDEKVAKDCQYERNGKLYNSREYSTEWDKLSFKSNSSQLNEASTNDYLRYNNMCFCYQNIEVDDKEEKEKFLNRERSISEENTDGHGFINDFSVCQAKDEIKEWKRSSPRKYNYEELKAGERVGMYQNKATDSFLADAGKVSVIENEREKNGMGSERSRDEANREIDRRDVDSGHSTLQLMDSGRSEGLSCEASVLSRRHVSLSIMQLSTAAQCARILADSLESVLDLAREELVTSDPQRPAIQENVDQLLGALQTLNETYPRYQPSLSGFENSQSKECKDSKVHETLKFTSLQKSTEFGHVTENSLKFSKDPSPETPLPPSHTNNDPFLSIVDSQSYEKDFTINGPTPSLALFMPDLSDSCVTKGNISTLNVLSDNIQRSGSKMENSINSMDKNLNNENTPTGFESKQGDEEIE